MTEARKKIRVNPMMPDDACAAIAQNTWESSDTYQRWLAHPETGDKMPDGSIYLGCYDNKDWFATAEDAKGEHGQRLQLSFNAAARYAENLEAHGHDDWTLPPGYKDRHNDTNILEEMHVHKDTGAFKGTYNNYADSASSWYWSSTQHRALSERAYQMGFGTRKSHWSLSTEETGSIRCVRTVPRSPKP